MVDSGATHCFISDKVVQQLQWPIHDASRFTEVLGDETTVRTQGLCRDMLISNAETYSISCCKFLLSSVDVILRVLVARNTGRGQAKLGVHDFEIWATTSTTWGTVPSQRNCGSRQLQALTEGDQGWCLWSMQEMSSPNTFEIPDSLSGPKKKV